MFIIFQYDIEPHNSVESWAYCGKYFWSFVVIFYLFVFFPAYPMKTQYRSTWCWIVWPKLDEADVGETTLQSIWLMDDGTNEAVDLIRFV